MSNLRVRLANENNKTVDSICPISENKHDRLPLTLSLLVVLDKGSIREIRSPFKGVYWNVAFERIYFITVFNSSYRYLESISI